MLSSGTTGRVAMASKIITGVSRRTVCQQKMVMKSALQHSGSVRCFGTATTSPTTMRADERNDVLRIVLTGGPCSGKSSALAYLQERLQEGHSSSSNHPQAVVYCAPEAATLLVHSGITFDPHFKSHTQQLQYQLAICRMQLALEDNLTRVAASRIRVDAGTGTGDVNSSVKQRAIILCDRGIIDNKGYMSDQLWQDVLGTLHEEEHAGPTATSSYEETLLQRYHGVIHMDTAAKGALAFFKNGETVDDSGKAVLRRESPEQASALDDQMWKVWQSHPYHRRVKNSNGSGDNSKSQKEKVHPFQVKLHNTAQAVQEICSEYARLPS